MTWYSLDLQQPNIPLVAPLWTFYGCLLSSQVYPNPRPVGDGPYRNLDWLVLVRSVGIIWAMSIGVEYTKVLWQRDRSSTSITNNGKNTVHGDKNQDNNINSKDDLQLPLLQIVVITVLAPLLLSFFDSAFVSTRAGIHRSPFDGLTLTLGISFFVLLVANQGPLRHLPIIREVFQTTLLAPLPALFGLIAHYTSTTGQSVLLSDLFTNQASSSSGYYMDSQLWAYIGAFSSVELARSIVYHLFLNSRTGARQRAASSTTSSRTGRRIGSISYICCYVFCAICAIVIFAQQRKNKGMVLRIAGQSVNQETADRLGIGWSMGAILITTYALPILLINVKSLLWLKNDSRTFAGRVSAYVPTMTLEQLVEVNTVQAIITPIVLAVVMSTTVFVVRG